MPPGWAICNSGGLSGWSISSFERSGRCRKLELLGLKASSLGYRSIFAFDWRLASSPLAWLTGAWVLWLICIGCCLQTRAFLSWNRCSKRGLQCLYCFYLTKPPVDGRFVNPSLSLWVRIVYFGTGQQRTCAMWANLILMTWCWDCWTCLVPTTSWWRYGFVLWCCWSAVWINSSVPSQGLRLFWNYWRSWIDGVDSAIDWDLPHPSSLAQLSSSLQQLLILDQPVWTLSVPQWPSTWCSWYSTSFRWRDFC